MPLSANLFRLESSILTQEKRATNRNSVATEKRGGGFSGVEYTKNHSSLEMQFQATNLGEGLPQMHQSLDFKRELFCWVLLIIKC